MPPNPLLDKLTEMADKEKKIKEFKSRLRMRGRLVEKSYSKKGNLKLKVKRADDECVFTVLKSHKDKFTLAESIPLNRSVYAQGIPKFRFVICTKIRILEKSVDGSRQSSLEAFESRHV